MREFARHRLKRVPWFGATRQGGAAMQATGDGEDRQALAGAFEAHQGPVAAMGLSLSWPAWG